MILSSRMSRCNGNGRGAPSGSSPEKPFSIPPTFHPGMKILITGTVQGVGFRPFVYTLANSLGLHGHILNRGAEVEIRLSEGADEPAVGEFLERIGSGAPPLAEIERIRILEHGPDEPDSDTTRAGKDAAPGMPGFTIVESRHGHRGSIIPPDTAICPDCRDELFEKSDRRFLFPFINCTNCGARFSVISDMPYDRRMTSMKPFRLCEECRHEFTDPTSRRYHAQTISCPTCGPRYIFYDGRRRKRDLDSLDAIKEFAGVIDGGGLGIMKGWGGMHIVCLPGVARGLREHFHRPSKPFALMARDMESIESTGIPVSDAERKTLLSPARPIVLLARPRGILDDIAPGLDTVGIMLPATPAQMLLFEYLRSGDHPGSSHPGMVVATSANIPGEPMATENEEALRLPADGYLLHDRNIIQRCDDSLLRVHPLESRDFTQFIRRSRGFVPSAFGPGFEHGIIGFGAERNVTAAFSSGGKLFLSQYIGNISRYGNLEFLSRTIDHFRHLIGMEEPDAIAMDMHPGYASRGTARRLGRELDVPVFEVQHHHAHAAALIAEYEKAEYEKSGSDRQGRHGRPPYGSKNADGNEHQLNRMVVMALDGAGYGTDGTIWGGELLHCSYTGFQRKGALEAIPLPGGDAAVRDPSRVVAAACRMHDVEYSGFPGGHRHPAAPSGSLFETAIREAPRSSGAGRFLDAVSCALDICCRRTYGGEPAMKLEPYLDLGLRETGPEKLAEMPVEEFAEDGITRWRTSRIIAALVESKIGKRSAREKAIAAAGAVLPVFAAMARRACNGAREADLDVVGITGGVAYNLPIVRTIEHSVIREGLTPFLHGFFPAGDGGISAGQCMVAGALLDDLPG